MRISDWSSDVCSSDLYDSHDTLDRLAALADQTGARAIWCLGDSFHDRNAATRIVPAVAERLARQAASARLLWIAGNHDGLSGGAWGGVRSEEHTSELQSLMRISSAVICLKK